MNILLKFKETAISVVPIMAIVVLLGLTVAPLESVMLWRFVIGGIMLILGLTIFLLGVDLGIQPMGEHCGAELTKKRSLPLLTIVAFVIGNNQGGAEVGMTMAFLGLVMQEIVDRKSVV